jgi:hypothetical protein
MADGRPKQAIERPGGWRLLEALALAGAVAGAVIAVVAWPSLPEELPTHFDAAGSPDGWGGCWTAVLLTGWAPPSSRLGGARSSDGGGLHRARSQGEMTSS